MFNRSFTSDHKTGQQTEPFCTPHFISPDKYTNLLCIDDTGEYVRY